MPESSKGPKTDLFGLKFDTQTEGLGMYIYIDNYIYTTLKFQGGLHTLKQRGMV